MENSMAVPQKVKSRITIQPSNSSSGYLYPEKIETFICKDLCILMFIAALFTLANTWKELKCPLLDDWVKKR